MRRPASVADHPGFPRTERETNAPEQPVAVNLPAGVYGGPPNQTAAQVSDGAFSLTKRIVAGEGLLQKETSTWCKSGSQV